MPTCRVLPWQGIRCAGVVFRRAYSSTGRSCSGMPCKERPWNASRRTNTMPLWLVGVMLPTSYRIFQPHGKVQRLVRCQDGQRHGTCIKRRWYRFCHCSATVTYLRWCICVANKLSSPSPHYRRWENGLARLIDHWKLSPVSMMRVERISRLLESERR